MSRTPLTLARPAAFTAVAALVCGGVAMASPAVAEPVGGAFVVTSLADTSDPGTLRSALEAAEESSGDDVITFEVTGTINITQQLPIITNGGITITGPGSGQLTIATPPAPDTVPAFIFVPQSGGDASFSGFTITGGAATVVADFGEGESESDAQGRFSLDDVVFDGSAHGIPAPALFVAGGSTRPDVLVSGSRIQGYSQGGETAGAVQIAEAKSVSIDDSTVDGNTSGSFGGGVLLVDVTDVQISGSTFSHNSAVSVGGGLVAIGSDAVTVTQSTFSGNHAGETGAAIVVSGSNRLSVNHSTVTGNTDDGIDGSAVVAASAPVSVDSSIISGNAGASTSVPDLLIPVFQDRAIAERLAAELPEVAAEDGSVVGKSIAPLIAAAEQEEAAPVEQTLGTVSSSLIGQPRSAFDASLWTLSPGSIFEADAQLGPLADNGGRTLTHLPATTSPAIDAGDVATLDGLVVDQRLAPRVVGNSVDIGSVEVQAAGSSPAVSTPNGAAARLPDTGAGVEMPLVALGGLLLGGVVLLGLQRVAARRRGNVGA
ncbi:choice-of-anchor Q domain-containing protein [Plantibacter sp. Mn2098]|uniref:choice-of-anchor Q domain-containing protein n=1 Tax=Plantibacter sp. Mn2098 TaxID=3395266 RepID=UPI003BC9831C